MQHAIATSKAALALVVLATLPAPQAAATPEARLEVKPMGATSKQVSTELRSRMKALVTTHLKELAEDRLLTAGQGYLVDGNISELTITMQPLVVEISCGVQLIVSAKKSHAILAMTSGQAAVQKPRRHFKPQLQRHLEMEALESAVRAASEELVQHFASKRKS